MLWQNSKSSLKRAHKRFDMLSLSHYFRVVCGMLNELPITIEWCRWSSWAHSQAWIIMDLHHMRLCLELDTVWTGPQPHLQSLRFHPVLQPLPDLRRFIHQTNVSFIVSYLCAVLIQTPTTYNNTARLLTASFDFGCLPDSLSAKRKQSVLKLCLTANEQKEQTKEPTRPMVLAL